MILMLPLRSLRRIIDDLWSEMRFLFGQYILVYTL